MSFTKKSKEPVSKAFVSTGKLPAYVDPVQPPSRREPFCSFANQSFTHNVELLLPEKLYDSVWAEASAKIKKVEYSRVFMSLSELVDGDFFNKYIKLGNILMLSEGRPGIDDKYILKDGRLRLDLAKETYERAGLLGKPIRDSGRLHLKTRYSVEIDFRPLSMLHGKKGFERIAWAFKNVLNRSVTWLFHDFAQPEEGIPRPIAQHHPFDYTITPVQSSREAVLTPLLNLADATGTNADLEEWALETFEWLGLVSIQSPRIHLSDEIDAYLSRYQVPKNDDTAATPHNMVQISWKGLIPASWIRDLFIILNDRCCKSKVTATPNFFALSAYAMKTEVREQLDGHSILWLSNQTPELQPMSSAGDPPREKIKNAEKSGNDFVIFKTCQNSLY